jgi:hypothetical protein
VFSEDQLKTALKGWLEAQEWEVEVAWAKIRGIDIHARWRTERWIIEAKGGGTLDATRVNYFLGVLGETLQRMDDPKAAYAGTRVLSGFDGRPLIKHVNFFGFKQAAHCGFLLLYAVRILSW